MHDSGTNGQESGAPLCVGRLHVDVLQSHAHRERILA